MLGRASVGRFPFSDVAISPDGRFGLVTNDNERTVSVLSLEPLKELTRLKTGKIPRTILFSPDGSHAYVANTDGGTVTVLGTKR